ncbi:hypothetical protein MMC30_005468 [Trapelia coarctata]|nr:hypothetical protein [Trapelia coarctata]
MTSLPTQSSIPSSLPLSTRSSADTNPPVPLSMLAPASGPTSTPHAHDYLPFTFEVELEMIIRPKANMNQGHPVPDRDATTRQTRDFNLLLLDAVAEILSAYGMPCNAFVPMDGEAPDYMRWNAMLDGSISKKHMCDGFYSIEVVSPKISANPGWVQQIDAFWSVFLQHFELRRDTSCGFYVHVSTATGSFSLDQLRMMAKAVVFWEPAAAWCAPLSRQDRILGFCKSNTNMPTPVAQVLSRHGDLRGLRYAYDYIDAVASDAIVDYVCADKYRAWNFRPCRSGGHGSIEFRRPPGVADGKKSKH